MALEELQSIADKLSVIYPSLAVSFDLSELRGYHYHTGVVFATFIPGVGREIARGGRYDNIGEFFGRARAATGFSSDLRLLTSLAKQEKEDRKVVYAPLADDPSLFETVRDLRASGMTVIQQLSDSANEMEELDCTAILKKENQNWIVKTLAN